MQATLGHSGARTGKPNQLGLGHPVPRIRIVTMAERIPTENREESELSHALTSCRRAGVSKPENIVDAAACTKSV